MLENLIHSATSMQPRNQRAYPVVDAVRAVLFDIDDTLVDTAGAFFRAIEAISLEYLPADTDTLAVLHHWRRDPGGFYAAYERGEIDYDRQRRLRADLIQTTFAGSKLGEANFAKWNGIFEREFVAGWHAIPDAVDALNILAEAGVPVGAVSNAGVAYQIRKLDAAGLSQVPMLVGVDTLGYGKPDPRVFLEGVRRIAQVNSLSALEPHEVVYVGDNPVNDVLASAAAGLQPIWYRPESESSASFEASGPLSVNYAVSSLIEASSAVIRKCVGVTRNAR